MDSDKLKKIEAGARIGGKGTARRKKKSLHPTPGADDRKINASLRKLGAVAVDNIEEINFFKVDGTVMHFTKPKFQVSIEMNLYGIRGTPEYKSITRVLPTLMDKVIARNSYNCGRREEATPDDDFEDIDIYSEIDKDETKEVISTNENVAPSGDISQYGAIVHEYDITKELFYSSLEMLKTKIQSVEKELDENVTDSVNNIPNKVLADVQPDIKTESRKYEATAKGKYYGRSSKSPFKNVGKIYPSKKQLSAEKKENGDAVDFYAFIGNDISDPKDTKSATFTSTKLTKAVEKKKSLNTKKGNQEYSLGISGYMAGKLSAINKGSVKPLKFATEKDKSKSENKTFYKGDENIEGRFASAGNTAIINPTGAVFSLPAPENISGATGKDDLTLSFPKKSGKPNIVSKVATVSSQSSVSIPKLLENISSPELTFELAEDPNASELAKFCNDESPYIDLTVYIKQGAIPRKFGKIAEKIKKHERSKPSSAGPATDHSFDVTSFILDSSSGNSRGAIPPLTSANISRPAILTAPVAYNEMPDDGFKFENIIEPEAPDPGTSQDAIETVEKSPSNNVEEMPMEQLSEDFGDMDFGEGL